MSRPGQKHAILQKAQNEWISQNLAKFTKFTNIPETERKSLEFQLFSEMIPNIIDFGFVLKGLARFCDFDNFPPKKW